MALELFNLKENPDHLKWLHTIVSNTKAFIAGTYHGLDAKHLQAYWNELAIGLTEESLRMNFLIDCSTAVF